MSEPITDAIAEGVSGIVGEAISHIDLPGPTGRQKPGRRLAAWSLGLGVVGPCSLGLLSLIGVVLGAASLRRGGFSKLALSGLIVSLLGAGVCVPTSGGPWLLAQVWPRYAVNRELTTAGLPAMPPSASEFNHERLSGFFSGGLYAAFKCDEADAMSYLDSIPNASNKRAIGFETELNRYNDEPAWFTPGSAQRGWHISDTPWGDSVGLEVVYDAETETMYIYWIWS